MSLRYAVLSLVALFAIFLLILKNYETWTRPIETAPERSTGKKQEAKIENPPAVRPQKVAGIAQPNAATIAVKNIFSPDRKDFPVQSSEARKIVRPQVVLYGVTIGDGYQFASIVNPGRHLLRGERETLSLKVGDKVGDYRLAKISSDRIALEAEGDAFEVLLYDPKTPKKRSDVRTAVSTPTKPATVTSTLPAAPVPEAPKTPPSVAQKATPVQEKVSTPPPVPTRPIPTPTAPTQVPTPTLPSRRGRMMYYPGARTPAAPGTPATPATPAPVQETEEN